MVPGPSIGRRDGGLVLDGAGSVRPCVGATRALLPSRSNDQLMGNPSTPRRDGAHIGGRRADDPPSAPLVEVGLQVRLSSRSFRLNSSLCGPGVALTP